MTKFILYYDPASIVDLKKFFNEYNYEAAISGKHDPRLKQNAPILQNVEGSYIKQSDIRKLIFRSYSNGKSYNEYVFARDSNARPIRYREPTN